MPPRKERIPVVLDTNVVVGFFTSKTRLSDNARVFDAWLVSRRLQLIMSSALTAEYIELLTRIGIDQKRIVKFRQLLLKVPTVTRINLGKRFTVSRDPDDDLLLGTAHTGRARYLVTNDRDLLDIPFKQRREFRFEIVKPGQLLRSLDS